MQDVRNECVVLLHGLARTARSMVPLAVAFEAAGYRVLNVAYPSRLHVIEVLAEVAVGKALARCAAFAPRAIHFVTHSLGGILVRQYLGRHAVANLGRVVMLAPPNQGSEVVDRFGWLPGFRLFNGPAIEQLGTGTASLPRRLGALHAPVGVIAGTRSVNWLLSTALPGPNDGKVSVASTRCAPSSSSTPSTNSTRSSATSPSARHAPSPTPSRTARW